MELTVIANDKDISGAVNKDLIDFEIVDDKGRSADSFKLTLADSGYEWPEKGAEIVVRIDGISMGVFLVDDVAISQNPDIFIINATASRKRSSFMQPRNVTYNNTNLKAVLEVLAARSNFEPVISDQLAEYAINNLQQLGQSDGDLIFSLSERFPVIIKPTHNRLIAKPEQDSKTVSGKAIEPIIIRPDNNTQITLKIVGRYQFEQITAFYQDMDAAKRIAVKVGAGGRNLDLMTTYPSESEARQAATAKLEETKRKRYQLTLSLIGNPNLKSEIPITLEGFKNNRINGDYVITKAIHSGAKGYKVQAFASAPKKTPSLN